MQHDHSKVSEAELSSSPDVNEAHSKNFPDVIENEWANASPEQKDKLNNTRIFEKSTIYAIGIPQAYCIPELLRSTMYFGQYGNVLSVEIKRRAYFCGEDRSTHYSAYICQISLNGGYFAPKLSVVVQIVHFMLIFLFIETGGGCEKKRPNRTTFPFERFFTQKIEVI